MITEIHPIVDHHIDFHRQIVSTQHGCSEERMSLVDVGALGERLLVREESN